MGSGLGGNELRLVGVAKEAILAIVVGGGASGGRWRWRIVEETRSGGAGTWCRGRGEGGGGGWQDEGMRELGGSGWYQTLLASSRTIVYTIVLVG